MHRDPIAALLLACLLTLGTTACNPEEVHEDNHHHGNHEHHEDNSSTEVQTQLMGMSANGTYHLRWESDPSPVPLNESFNMTVWVENPDRSAMIEGATLTVDATMPAHGHGMNTTPTVSANGDGSFEVDGMLLHMPGKWVLELGVEDSEMGEDSAKLDINCCGE